MFTRAILVVMVGLLLAACGSSSRLIQHGNYDAAIQKSVDRLKRNPENRKEILNLERAFRIISEQNQERIRFLNAQGDPGGLVEVVDLYTRMKARQTLIRTVTPLHLPDRVVQFPYINFDEKIIAASRGAAEFSYNRALELMARNDRLSYREAWHNLAVVQELAPHYRDVDLLMDEAYQKGLSRALVAVQNHTHLNLPEEYKQQLLTVDTRGLDNPWVEFYYADLDETISFDYYMLVNLRQILISPDQTNQTDRQFRREVEDGFDYVLDARGNVKKDSLGNDIKITRYKTLTCVLVESHQVKTITIQGDLEIFSHHPRKLLKREPLGASGRFEHRSARAIGDRGALDQEALRIADIKPLPFPTDVDMILLTSAGLRLSISEAIRRNRTFVR